MIALSRKTRQKKPIQICSNYSTQVQKQNNIRRYKIPDPSTNVRFWMIPHQGNHRRDHIKATEHSSNHHSHPKQQKDSIFFPMEPTKTSKPEKGERHTAIRCSKELKRCGLFSCHGFPLLNRSNNPHSGWRKPKGWWKGETAPEIAIIAMTIPSTSSNLATTLNLSSGSETRVGNEEDFHVSIATA